MTRYSFLLLFLLPQPILGQTVGTLFITEDTTLTENHEGNIIVDADDVTLDCHLFSVSGTGSGNGIELRGRSGVKVRRCNVQGFDFGFLLVDSNRNKLEENTAVDNGRNGFRLVRSVENTLKVNTANGNAQSGFFILRSDNNTLKVNTAVDNGLGRNRNQRNGFHLFGSDNNTLTYNTAVGNRRAGFSLGDSNNNTVEDNTAEGGHRTGFDLSGSSNNTVEDNTAEGNLTGFQLQASLRGIGSNNNTFDDNTANGNARNGFIVLDTSELNTFIENEGCGNGDGINFFDALDESTGAGNVWVDNDFCTSSGF